MYFRDHTKTYRTSGLKREGRKTRITELRDYTYERMPDDESLTEVVPGYTYREKGGLEFRVIKILEKDRVVAKLEEGQSMTLPLLCLDEFDTEYYDIPFSKGLIVLAKRLLTGRVGDVQKYRRVLIKVPGFKAYDDFHVIGRGDTMIDLELFLISLSVSLDLPIEQIGGMEGIEKGTILEHRIVTKGNRSENHIIGDDGYLKIEVRFPWEVILFKELQYFSLTYDDAFSVNTKGSCEEERVLEEEKFMMPEPYFKEDGWRNREILY